MAAEQAHHAPLVAGHLATLVHAYGEFDAHDGLGSMTERTAANPVARTALVPSTPEARGLDATPPMQAQSRKASDETTAAILDVIERDELGPVAVGNHGYRCLCPRDGLAPLAHHASLAAGHLSCVRPSTVRRAALRGSAKTRSLR